MIMKAALRSIPKAHTSKLIGALTLVRNHTSALGKDALGALHAQMS